MLFYQLLEWSRLEQGHHQAPRILPRRGIFELLFKFRNICEIVFVVFAFVEFNFEYFNVHAVEWKLILEAEELVGDFRQFDLVLKVHLGSFSV